MNELGEVISVGTATKSIEVPAAGLIVIVGPNNAGKTTVLRNIVTGIAHGMYSGLPAVVTEVKVREPTNEVLAQVLADHASEAPDGKATYVVQGMAFQAVSLEELAAQFRDPVLRELRTKAINIMDGSNRLTLADPQQAIDVLTPLASRSALQRLLVDPGARAAFSDAMKRAFDTDVIVDGPARDLVRIRLGSVEGEEPKFGSGEYQAYVTKINMLPAIETQGDGMRAYAGIALSLLSNRQPYTFIDEPEAFLHPPQARELARLAQNLAVREGHQVFLATHSRDILLGAMAADPLPTIIRVTREPAGQAQLEGLSGTELQQLWRDPIIRYSNALDGIFYAQVVVAEDDSDCRWFQAVLDDIRSREPDFGRDVLFVPAGGKDKVAVIVAALRGLGVDARATLDFDALRGERVIKDLVEAQRGDWASFKPSISALNSQINATSQSIDGATLGEKVAELIRNHSGPPSEGLISEIVSSLGSNGGWSASKSNGLESLRGDVHALGSSVVERLDSLGICVVTTGEVESFDRGASGHGPKWVSAALERRAHQNNAAAEAHLRRLLARL
jgi:ABC-type cobalamin/Fe3+-siderophores transport system ATPase subunit